MFSPFPSPHPGPSGSGQWAFYVLCMGKGCVFWQRSACAMIKWIWTSEKPLGSCFIRVNHVHYGSYQPRMSLAKKKITVKITVKSEQSQATKYPSATLQFTLFTPRFTRCWVSHVWPSGQVSPNARHLLWLRHYSKLKEYKEKCLFSWSLHGNRRNTVDRLSTIHRMLYG